MKNEPCRILVVCHGNICRSPMAEYIFRDLAQKSGAGNAFWVESAATSREELNRPVYPPAARVLAGMGIDCSKKRARQMTRRDYDAFDLLVAMDRTNLHNMLRILGGDPEGKIRLLLGSEEVADPWYTGDFSAAERDIVRGCRSLLETLLLP